MKGNREREVQPVHIQRLPHQGTSQFRAVFRKRRSLTKKII